MVDWNFSQNYVDALNEIGPVKAKRITEYGFKKDTKDCDLVCGTSDYDCILLTRDKTTIDHHVFKPCTHGGIIKIMKSRPFIEDVVAFVKAFCQSGKRSLAEHNVIDLHADKAVIHKHDGATETVRF
jgi:hypothetical protein